MVSESKLQALLKEVRERICFPSGCMRAIVFCGWARSGLSGHEVPRMAGRAVGGGQSARGMPSACRYCCPKLALVGLELCVRPALPRRWPQLRVMRRADPSAKALIFSQVRLLSSCGPAEQLWAC